MIFESRVDISKIWYFGNNRANNLKLAPPKWYSPFFLTTDYSYAEEYSDYGVYTITLKSEAKSKILDFNKDSDVKKLHWPIELIDNIRTGNNDLNGIAYDMYVLAGYSNSQEVFNRYWYLSDAAYDFDVRSENIFDIVQKNTTWASEKYHRFLLQMWKDIYDAGFDGFMHFEFGKKIIALFNFKCMDKISIKPVKAIVNEKLKNRTLKNYPFSIEDESIIKCKSNLNESKATYLQKYKDETDVKKIVDVFWQIKSRLSAPQNDIDWWIKKPFADLKSFVLNFDTSNKRQRRDANYKQQAIDNGAKLLDIKDGYEIWYVPTYEAMVAIGRFYKGRSAKWCVASDDPEFWFDYHDEDEFVVLVREHPQNDQFDKVAIQMSSHGRYYNEDNIISWDLENEDQTFTDDSLIKYAWQLFKDNGEQREQYFS